MRVPRRIAMPQYVEQVARADGCDDLLEPYATLALQLRVLRLAPSKRFHLTSI